MCSDEKSRCRYNKRRTGKNYNNSAKAIDGMCQRTSAIYYSYVINRAAGESVFIKMIMKFACKSHVMMLHHMVKKDVAAQDRNLRGRQDEGNVTINMHNAHKK